MSIDYREDHDTMGTVRVSPSKALYQAQTQRSIENFYFGTSERQSLYIIRALAIVKLGCARANHKMGVLKEEYLKAIEAAYDKIAEGVDRVDEEVVEQFPLSIWQTGSGTQSNMNMNEVLATLANKHLNPDGPLGAKTPIHPNDHVNMSQSSNDVFPTAMHIAMLSLVEQRLLPTADILLAALNKKVKEFGEIPKIGRTHMMDAVPLTLGDEFSAYATALEACIGNLKTAVVPHLRNLALGATAVGSGLNTPKGFDECAAEEISKITGLQFAAAPNKFYALSQITPMVMLAGNLMPLASSLLKMANDLRLLASGPRAGISEIIIPANEPGSSVMPGKVNPTQIESLAMVCTQALGSCQTIVMNNTFGHLQLNVFLPCTFDNARRAVELLSRSMENFTERCLIGMKANTEVIEAHLNDSLMLVTALNKHIGYDNAAKIAKHAHENKLNLKQSAVELNLLKPEEFDQYVQPNKMAKPHN